MVIWTVMGLTMQRWSWCTSPAVVALSITLPRLWMLTAVASCLLASAAHPQTFHLDLDQGRKHYEELFAERAVWDTVGTIDLTTITTDRSQRDSRVQSALETSQFPLATFSLTSPVELPEGAATGESFRADAEGDLTVHGVTNPVTFGIEAQLVDAVVVVVGSAEIVFDDYGVTAPSAPVVLSVEDHGIVEFQLLFTR